MNDILHLPFDGAMSAVLVSEIQHSHHLMYHVTFESGYSNNIFTDVETGKWVEEDLGYTGLAESLGSEILKMRLKLLHVPRILTWQAFTRNGQMMKFAFFGYMDGLHKMFEIYHSNRKYLYTLMEVSQDEWHVLGNNNVCMEKIDSSFIYDVIKVLPLYSYFD